MKKIISLFLFLSIFLLSGCVQKDLIDVYLFAERFSERSENFEIDTSSLVAEEENGELLFPITFSDKILITVRTNEKTSLLTSVSVVYVYKDKKYISDKDFLLMKEIIESSVRAFTNFRNTDDIFENLSLEGKEKLLKYTHLHYEKEFYKFSLISDEVGIYFTASTERR